MSAMPGITASGASSTTGVGPNPNGGWRGISSARSGLKRGTCRSCRGRRRYAFTDFSELKFIWQLNGHKGRLTLPLAPAAKGELEIPAPSRTAEGDSVSLRVTGASGAVIDDAVIHLGSERSPCHSLPPARRAGATIET